MPTSSVLDGGKRWLNTEDAVSSPIRETVQKAMRHARDVPPSEKLYRITLGTGKVQAGGRRHHGGTISVMERKAGSTCSKCFAISGSQEIAVGSCKDALRDAVGWLSKIMAWTGAAGRRDPSVT